MEYCPSYYYTSPFLNNNNNTSQNNQNGKIEEIDNTLDNIKNNIEMMNKPHQIEILKILKKNPTIKLNENKSGVYVNISFLPQDTIDELLEYIAYIKAQESSLKDLEVQKNDFKNTFFMEKGVKDEMLLYNSIGLHK